MSGRSLTQLRLTVLVAMLAVTGACSTQGKRAAAEDEKLPIVRSMLAGTMKLAPEERVKGIAVDVAGNPEVSAALREQLVKVGYKAMPAGGGAPYVLQVTPVFIGKDSARPSVDYEDLAKGGTDFSKFIPSLWNALPRKFYPQHGDPVIIALDVAGRVLGVKDYVDRVWEGRRRQDPVDALIMQITLTGNAAEQRMQILTQTYAEGVPLNLLIDDNIKMLMWMLE